MKTAIAPENALRHRLAVAANFGVDAPSGALTGLQLMAAGREALGHGYWIDEKSLETALACVSGTGGLLKGYVTHNHAGPCESPYSDLGCAESDDASSELNVAGWFSGLAVANGQLIAARFDFYDAFKKNYAPQFEQISEMAAKTPALLGLSIELWGYLVYIDTANVEYGAPPEKTELLYGGMPVLRVTELFAAAFVGQGAATEGLFAKLSRRLKGMLAPTAPRPTAPAAAPAPDTLSPNQQSLPPSHIATMKVLQEIKAKFGSNAARYHAALAIVAESTDSSALTIEAIEGKLAAYEVATLGTQLATVTTERDTLKASLATAQADLATARAQVETLKASGHTGALNLGAGAGAPGATETNPFVSGNLTEQAVLLKANPEQAALLKAAATAARK